MPSPPPPEEGKPTVSTSAPTDGTTMKLDLSKSAYLNEFFKQIDTYVKLLVSNNLRILVVLLEDIIDRRSNYEKMIHTYPLAGVS